MTVSIRALHPLFMGEVTGIDIAKPLSAAEVAAIEAGMDRHAVLIFHGQTITGDQQLAFTANFGPLQEGANTSTKRENLRLDPIFADPSNLDRDGRPRDRLHPARLDKMGNRLWHTDASFKARGAKYSALYGRVLPPAGGDTEFADMRAAYDALDAATKAEVEDLVCEHSLTYSRAQLGYTHVEADDLRRFPPVRHRLVRVHPVTGRKSLYLASHIGGIVGWQRPEAMAFIRDLMEHATQPEFIYAHRWTVGDVVMWDNRQTMHRGRRYDDIAYPRDVRRTTVVGDDSPAESLPLAG